MKYNLLLVYSLCVFGWWKRVHTTCTTQVDPNKYVCKPLECITCERRVIAFHANLKHVLINIPTNSILKFENVLLNKGGGYDANTGIFTAPEDGVYSFAWSFLSNTRGTVYVAAVVDNVHKVHTCIAEQKSKHINTSGHFLSELKKGNKVWLKTWAHTATCIYYDSFTYFSGFQISSL